MRTPPLRILLIGTALVVASAAALTWVLWPEQDPYPDQPEAQYSAADVREFDDLSVMTATSALVVLGTVTAVEPGETIELDDGSGEVHTNRNVTIAVEEVLFNRYEVDITETVVMVEGYWSDGVGYAREGVPWVEVGDSGYFYLGASPPERDDSGTYGLINTYGRVLVDESSEDDVEIPGAWEEEGPWKAAGLVGADDSAFEAEIEDAASLANSGAVEPELVTVCEPSDPEDENSEPICWEE